MPHPGKRDREISDRQPRPSRQANRHYFSRPAWARDYLGTCHQNMIVEARWNLREAVASAPQDPLERKPIVP